MDGLESPETALGDTVSQDLSAIGPALEEALRAAQREPRLAATVALARRYARLLDEAAADRKYRKPLKILQAMADHYQATVRLTPTDERALEEAVVLITTALGEHSVASDLGPKLLAALTALNMTLAASSKTDPRGASGDTGGEPSPAQAARAERDRLRLVNGGGAG